VEAVTKELEPYSRFLGKNGASKDALEGLLQLPATLWPEQAQKALQQLKTRMGDGMVSMTYQELLTSLGAQSTLTKDKTLALARALESLNMGIEPDVLGGAKTPKAEERVVLFAVPPGEVTSRATPAYQAAMLTLQLASAVASADGEFNVKEMSHLREQTQAWTHLTPNHLRRLLAHLRLLMVAPVTLTSLKKKLEPLESSAKETIAAFMATVAQSDGTVSPDEVKMLEKVYKALGVEPKKVFSDVHAAAAGVQPSESLKAEAGGFKLDPARIAALQQDSAKVSALLANIFQRRRRPGRCVARTRGRYRARGG
jgi:tellurite resistance protein